MTNRLKQSHWDQVMRRSPPARQGRATNGGQWLALAGLLFLAAGIWLPIFHLAAPVTLGQVSGGYLVIVLSLLGIIGVSAIRRWWLPLGLAGLGTYATLVAAGLQVADWTPQVELAAGWLLLILGAVLVLAAAAIGEYLSHRDRKPTRIDLDFEFPAIAQRSSLAALQSGWELRN